jgi:PDZ domain-containing protein
MTTVGVDDNLKSFDALRAWLDPQVELVPRAAIYPPGKSAQQVEQENTTQFTNSETDAEVAALGYLRQPVKVVVGPLTPDAPASGVLKEGDQLLSVNGQQVSSPAEVSQVLLATRPGQEIPVTYRRGDGPPTSTAVKLGSRPDGPQGFLGITPEGRPQDPNEIKISLSDVGGPSAGLMFALGIIQEVGPSDLTAGRFIAGTGTIDADGTVGPIGGIQLKMIAARNAGATVFLAPAGNCSDVVGAVPSGLRVVKVSTLHGAVTDLQGINARRAVPSC